MPRGKTKTKKCETCSREISLFAYNRHVTSKVCLTPNVKKKRVAWNKGKDKLSDSRIVKLAENISRALRSLPSGYRKGHSEETKKKLSDIRKKFLELNPEKVPYVLNHRSKKSYPEKYFAECLINYMQIVEQYRIRRYSLDFANPVKKRYLEIDGEQHYVDKRVVEHDKIRTQYLDSLGWVGVRIRWSEFQKLSSDDKKLKIQEILNFMQ